MTVGERPVTSSGRRRVLVSAMVVGVAVALLPVLPRVLEADGAPARGPRELPLTAHGLRAPHELAG